MQGTVDAQEQAPTAHAVDFCAIDALTSVANVLRGSFENVSANLSDDPRLKNSKTATF